MQTAVAPKSKPSLLERARLRALKNFARHTQRGHRLRAAFWAGVFSGINGLRH